jgi:hypothetical protein
MKLPFFPSEKLVDTKICFIHVPKCAGTSIFDSIRNQYRLRDRAFRSDRFVNINATATAKGSKVLNESLWGYREKILIYYLSAKKYKFISGHFPFSDRAVKYYQKEWMFISILRNPVDRWLSHYFFNRYKQGKHFATNLSIEEYADTEDGQSLGLLYHHIFNGNPDADIEATEEAYEKAIGNIDKLTCIGVVEHLDDFCRNFYERFGVRIAVDKKNKSPLSKKDRYEKITDAIIKKVEKICEPDIKIYNYVLEKLNLKAKS